MKKILQLILFIILISIIVIFYLKFFDQEETMIKNNNYVGQKEENNIIKNLNYEIRIKEKNDYSISADFSEIFYEKGTEYLSMKKVYAVIKDNNENLYINSENAVYNSKNFYTVFKKNIKINFLDNIIYAEKMILDFDNNIILISDKVKFDGSIGTMKADKININLVTKKINISMYDSSQNIKITTKK